ncbi:hypothetical protein TSUD_145430 [Trifolium subterraneum]|uniref:HMA domain-containing protein n=1 Tax=Trifolium subterraneum TaxID=3900 RepID=A0A2Z6MDB2_TRISU|nr:hypothetical protein TSUD_145430 [Trifolium subterraneum]
MVIKLQMDCDKCRNKALKTAAEVKGVTSVSLEGDDKDRIAVTGDNVDTVCLANQLKKKFSCVTILTIEEVKKKTEEEKKKEEAKKKEEEKKKMMEACRDVLFGCNKCHNSSCSGKCSKCTICESTKCDGKHCVTICFKCENPKSNCSCKSNCSICDNHNCNGCKPKPPSPQCPQWCTCHKCYAPYQPCYNPCPPNYMVCYDPNPDSCTIM